MAERTATIDIDGTPDAVWAVAGDFGGIPVAWTRPSISSHGALDTLAGGE